MLKTSHDVPAAAEHQQQHQGPLLPSNEIHHVSFCDIAPAENSYRYHEAMIGQSSEKKQDEDCLIGANTYTTPLMHDYKFDYTEINKKLATEKHFIYGDQDSDYFFKKTVWKNLYEVEEIDNYYYDYRQARVRCVTVSAIIVGLFLLVFIMFTLMACGVVKRYQDDI